MTDKPAPVLYWFRQDLRLADLPALNAAAQAAADGGTTVLPCFILDDTSPGEWALGEASQWWLHHSLLSLAEQITAKGGELVVRRGRSDEALAQLASETGAGRVYCSQAYEPWNRELEARVGKQLEAQDVSLHTLPGALLFTPGDILNQSGEAFKVFTPFWRRCRSQLPTDKLAQPPGDGAFAAGVVSGLATDDWDLLPKQWQPSPEWQEMWSPGTSGAARALETFIERALEGYRDDRDKPGVAGTSRLSPHLHWGEISPRQVLATLRAAGTDDLEDDREKFLAELGWREFNQHLLYHFPHIDAQPFKDDFRNMPWQANEEGYQAWCQGRTGYPIVDAGMRELWQTGFMHNRVRMICASFLTKHLLVPWQWGAKWFWDTLVDADLANNSGGWQWVAGCGADASPWFRIFNPVLQGKKFDPDGDYVRRWVPELAALPAKHIHDPWEMPPMLLAAEGVELGSDYPHPIVDHKEAREMALSAYQERSAGTGSEATG